MAEFPKVMNLSGFQIQNEDGSWRDVKGFASVEITTSPTPEEIEEAKAWERSVPQSTRAFHFGTVKQPEEYLKVWDDLHRRALEAGAALNRPSQQILDAVDRYAERAGVQLLPWQKEFMARVMANPDKKFAIHAPRQQGLTALNKTFEKYYEHKKEIEGMTAGQPIYDEVENVEPYFGWKKSELRERIATLELSNRRLSEATNKYAAENASLQRTIIQRDETITTLNRRITNQRTNLRQLNKHVRENAERRAKAEQENRLLNSRVNSLRDILNTMDTQNERLRAVAYPAKPHWWSRRPAVDAAEAALARLRAVPKAIQSPGLVASIRVLEEEIAK